MYGVTKLAGEKAVIAATPKHVIIRTAWVFSEYGNNFLKTMLRLGNERGNVNVVADQYGCPTYAGDLAEAILSIAQSMNADPTWDQYGVFHFCGEEATSWHGFARMIFDAADRVEILSKPVLLRAIASDQYPTPAQILPTLYWTA